MYIINAKISFLQKSYMTFAKKKSKLLLTDNPTNRTSRVNWTAWSHQWQPHNVLLPSENPMAKKLTTLQRRQNEREGVSNRRRLVVISTVFSGADQIKHQSSASLAFCAGIHRWPVNSPHKRPIARKMLPFDDVIMRLSISWLQWENWWL